MAFFSDDLLYYSFAFLTTTLVGLVLYLKWSFTYWRRRGLEYLPPSIPCGNTAKLYTSKVSFGEQFAEFYRKFKAKGLKHGGVFMFQRPFYIPVDPEIIKNIMQRDFQHFVDRGIYVNEQVDPLSGHLFALEGAKWRNLRSKLTPTFTSGKMKMMFDTMASCAKELDLLMNRATLTEEPIEIKDVLARFTTDVISSCAFGLDSNSLKDPYTEFRRYGSRIFQNTLWESIRNFGQFVIPHSLLSMLKMKAMKPDVEAFMMDLVKKTVDYREKNNVYRKDFLHLLLQLKNRGKLLDDKTINDNPRTRNKVTMTINELAAQVFVFFAAGYETSSTTMTFALYELALNSEIQDQLRREIHKVIEKHNNQVTYEALMEMTYMDQIINETLRKYPPLPFLSRICTKSYQVPNTNLHLDKGTMVVIPILGLQHDVEHYPNPSYFDPERFNEENMKSRQAFTWMPFGEGPRACIGLRFGMLETKIGLTTLLSNYRVALNSKTKQPLTMDPKNLIATIDSGIWLDISKVN